MKMGVFTCALAIIWGGFSVSYAALPAIKEEQQQQQLQQQQEQTQTIGKQSKDSILDGKSVEPQEKDKNIVDKWGRRLTDENGKVLRDPIAADEPRPEPGKNFKAENDEFAKKMGYHAEWFNPERNAAFIYADNIKYMKEELQLDWWHVGNMDPYVRYRTDVDIPKLLTGFKAVEQGVYIGCNPEGTFLSYLATNVMPTDYLFTSDNSYGIIEIEGLKRSGMYQNAEGLNVKGSDHSMDFTFSHAGHVDFTFNGRLYGGGIILNSKDTSRSFEMNVGGDCEILTNATPYISPQDAATQAGATLGMSPVNRDPRKETFSTWPSTIEWLAEYEDWQVKNGQWDKNYKVPYLTRLKNPSATYPIPPPLYKP